jgi:hypothetical protein
MVNIDVKVSKNTDVTQNLKKYTTKKRNAKAQELTDNFLPLKPFKQLLHERYTR